MPVAELLQRVPSSELTEWMAFYELEPFGSPVLDIYAARLTAITYNANVPHKDQTKVDDWYLVDHGQAIEKKQTPEEILAAFKNWAVTNANIKHTDS